MDLYICIMYLCIYIYIFFFVFYFFFPMAFLFDFVMVKQCISLFFVFAVRVGPMEISLLMFLNVCFQNVQGKVGV